MALSGHAVTISPTLFLVLILLERKSLGAVYYSSQLWLGQSYRSGAPFTCHQRAAPKRRPSSAHWYRWV